MFLDAPCSLASLSPEVLHNIVIYISNSRDFAAFTSTCRLHRSFFTANVWASSLITKHGKDLALYSTRAFRAVNGIMSGYGRPVRIDTEQPAHYKFGNEEVVKELVRKGCTAESEEEEGTTFDDWVLVWAAATGDVELVRMLIERGSRNTDEALIQAAYLGHANIVRFLRDEAEASVHENDNESMLAAVESGSVDVVEALLEGGVVIREEDVQLEREESFLHCAVRHGLPFVKFLVVRGIITLQFVEEWFTMENGMALSFAVEKGDMELVRYLLENGLDLDEFEHGMDSMCILALRNGHVELHDFIIQHVLADADDKEKLMVEAVTTDFHGLLEALIKSGISVEDVDKKVRLEDGKGLLELAVEKNATDVLPILLNTLNCPDELIVTAIEIHRTNMVQTLLNQKSEITSVQKEMLLVAAVENKCYGLVSSLLESDANLDFPDELIVTAAKTGAHPEMVKMLLRHKGASSAALVAFLFEAANDDQRQSLCDIPDELVTTAAEKGDVEIVVLLLKNMRKDSDALCGQILSRAVMSGDSYLLDAFLRNSGGVFSKTALSQVLVEHLAHFKDRPLMKTITKLLDAGADIHFDGEKPLVEVCKLRLGNLVRFLLEKGAHPNGNGSLLVDVFPFLCDKSADGSMQIIGAGHGVLKMLMKACADLNANHGQLLIDACAAGHLGLVKTLLSEGANITARNGQALVVAVEGGHAEVVMTLLKAGVNVQDSLKDMDMIRDAMALLNRDETVLNLLKDRLELNSANTFSNHRSNSGGNQNSSGSKSKKRKRKKQTQGTVTESRPQQPVPQQPVPQQSGPQQSGPEQPDPQQSGSQQYAYGPQQHSYQQYGYQQHTYQQYGYQQYAYGPQ
ncbi:hypothetical protein HK102_005671, partial [Quaeritorhiza haematococci]